MIDNFAIAITHFLLAVALWRLMTRPDLDRDPDDPPPEPTRFRRFRPKPTNKANGDG